ncbi:MAG TPA: IPT/TIG domain-containing protein [Cellvibrio sp.]|nr:IPT/TIG domain-containing protein [Cellvibrio sp.]
MINACGGGGGGDSGGSNDTKSPTLTISKTSLSFNSALGLTNPPEQTLIASLSNADSLNGDVYVKITAPDERFFDANASISGSQGAITVGMTTADDAGVGVHKSQFEVHVCLDYSCNKEVKGSPKIIAVTYTVDKPSVTFEEKQILFNTKQGDRPSANNLFVYFSSTPVSEQSSNASYDGLYFKVTYQGTIQDWLKISMNDYSHMNIAVTKSLAPGVYKAEMELQTSVPLYKSVKVPIIYTVSAGDIAIDRPDVVFNITDNSDPAALYTTIHATSLTSAKIDWEITSDQNWLSTETSNITTEKADIKFNLNKNAAFLKNGQHHAMVTISNKNDRSIFYLASVTLNADLIQFDYITPYFGYTANTQKIYATGQGFNKLAGRKLKFNQTEITNYQVISDTKLSFTPPQLPTGSYNLSIAGDAENLFSKASYTIIEPETYQNKTIAFPSEEYMTDVI